MNGDSFLAGVVEGFYGQPWKQGQRLKLFERMARWGLNTYFYAPKDDLKHRALWRECYREAELQDLQTLIQAARDQDVRFIYGLSPGLDIVHAEPKERDLIKARFEQLIAIGCEHFALLFDDLPGQLTERDRQQYGSPAEAQSDVTNDIVRWFRGRCPDGRFLFCPTAYCDRMVSWQLGGAGYLEALGRLLDATVDVLWTGPEIVSREIPVDSIRALTKRIRREPVIWDNLHANDYDGRRLYCGPYAGRPPELRRVVRGILANPNNEFVLNYVPLRTLGAYVTEQEGWDPRAAYLAALQEWQDHYATCGEPLKLEDLTLLADAYYLPHEEGPEARVLIELIQTLMERPVSEWGERYGQFLAMNRRVQALFEQLTELRDRELFYAWSRRAWDLKEELQLVEGYLAAKQSGQLQPDGFRSENHLAGTYRGGIVAELQRCLTMDRQGRFRPGDQVGGLQAADGLMENDPRAGG